MCRYAFCTGSPPGESCPTTGRSHRPPGRTPHRPDTGPAQTQSDPLSPVRPRIIFVTTLTLDYTIRVHADRVRAVKNADADNKSRAKPRPDGGPETVERVMRVDANASENVRVVAMSGRESVRAVSIVLWGSQICASSNHRSRVQRERGFFRRAAHSGLVPVLHLAPLRARGPVLILVFVALAVVFVRHVRPVQLLALGPVDPTQSRKIERERLVELRLGRASRQGQIR